MKKPSISLFIAPLMFFSISRLMADTYENWSFSRDLTINTSASGANVSTSQIKFPLLVRLSAADSSIFNDALANGADIRFSGVTSSGGIGTHYPYQRELWDKTNKKAALWVLVDTLKGNGTTQRVRMFWGKSSAADSSRASAVFDTANGFIGVWHLAENPDSSANTVKDATVNGLNATAKGGMTGADLVDAVIGKGHHFDGTDDADSIPFKQALNTANAVTLSAWVNVAAFQSFSRIISRGMPIDSNPWTVYCLNTHALNSKWRGEVSSGAVGSQTNVQGKTDLMINTWYFVAFTYDQSNMKMYRDGVQDSTSTAATTAMSTSQTTPLMIGKSNHGNCPFSGIIDEAIAAKAARSADWIKLCYQNQKSGSTMLTAGTIPPIAPSSLKYPFNPVKYYINAAAAANTPTCVGPVDSFTVAPPLPGGLFIDNSTGGITGTPLAAAATANYIVTAKNKTGSDTETVVITVYGAPTNLAYTADSASYIVNTAIAADVPTCTGVVDSFTVSPPLPKGLSIDKTTGVIAGTPTAEAAKASYTVTAHNPAGKAMTVLSFTVISGPSEVHYRTRVLSCIITTAIIPDTPSVTGTVTAWAVAPPLPAGLSLDTTNGIIAGTPTETVERTDFIVTARNSAGFAKDTVSIVVAHDTSAPENSLRISGVYLGDSSVVVYLDSISSIDTSKIVSVEVQYDFSDSVNFSTATLKEISAAAVRGTTGNRFTVTLVNPLFSGAQRPLHCAVSLKGVNGAVSSRKTTTFMVGKARPNNPVRLHARALSSSSIELSWPRVTGMDSIRVWYSNKKPVPLSFDFSETEFLKQYVSQVDVSDTLDELEPGTMYYFGVQVDSGGLWSMVTVDSRDSAKTDTLSDTVALRNTIVVDTVYFDEQTNGIKAVITVDTTGHFSDALVAGLSWSIDRAAVDTGSRPSGQSKPNIKPRDTLTALLGDQVLFNTTYYVGAWLQKKGSRWSPPINRSKDSLHTPDFMWQNVKYGVGFDTAYADNKIFRICIDSAVSSQIGIDNNKIVRWTPPEVPQGFIPLSIGFQFGINIQSGPLYIGIKYGAIPAGNFASEVRMYRYDKGMWLLDRSPLSHDSANGYVSVFTGDISVPFIVMIDTLYPACRPLRAIKDTVTANEEIIDSFSISDNIANVRWRFQCARGGDGYDQSVLSPLDTGTLSSNTGSVGTWIDGGYVSADQGVRAILILEDGDHGDTIILSRRVIREGGSDAMTTVPMKWVPVRVTAFLDKPRAPDALKKICPDSIWNYDITKSRLFRWCTYPGNAALPAADRWVEYADSTESLFSLIPGRVIWLKTRAAVTIDFGRSVTPDLARPDSIELQPMLWTDMALPYRFDIKLGDILDATKASAPGADSLHFISWKRENDTGNFKMDEIYFPLMGIGDPATTMSAVQGNSLGAAYSIYNPMAQPVKLVIPPLPVSMSRFPAHPGLKKASALPWILKLSGRTSAGSLSPVFCGYRQGDPGRHYYPAAPGLGETVTIRLCDEANRQFGYAINDGSIDKEGGGAYTVAFNNHTDHADRISFTVEALNGMPPDMRLAILDPASVTLENGANPQTVDIGAHGSVYRELIMGNESYIAKARSGASIARLALVGAYPNPFKRSIRIRFSIPATEVRTARFDIFGADGREVWTADVSCAGPAGIREVVWNGKCTNKGLAASGMYIVRMTAFNTAGLTRGVFEKKIMFLR